MDRYGEIYTTYKMILDAIRKVPTATVLLNGDSPLFYKPAIPNPVQYFGFDLEKGQPNWLTTILKEFSALTGKVSFKYETQYLWNLGAYICENCGCKRPELDYRWPNLVELTNNRSRFVIDGQDTAFKSVDSTTSTMPWLRLPLPVSSALIHNSSKDLTKEPCCLWSSETFHIGDKGMHPGSY